MKQDSVTARRILIAGGGIGGLTAALLLAQDGHEVQLFEQCPVFSEAGAGIQLSPNCSQVLHRLGLERQLAESAVLPQATEFRDWRTGRLICSAPLGRAARERYCWPYYHIYRPDLLEILVSAASDLGNVELHTSARLMTFTQRPASVVADFESGESGKEVRADLLIGADGIHSRVRTCLWGDDRPEFTGMVAWRTLIPAELLPEGLTRPAAGVWWGPGRHLVHYPVRSGAWINCVYVAAQSGWELESWVEAGDREELRLAFSGWHDQVQQLTDNTDESNLYKWALYDRAPMAAWGAGRVTLLGDACHPTLPFLAQGAALAIEDAAVLATCLRGREGVVGQLRRYEALRKKRTASIQKGSRRNGFWFHARGPGAWLRNLLAAPLQRRLMDRIYAYDPLKIT